MARFSGTQIEVGDNGRAIFFRVARSLAAAVQPGQAFLREDVPRRPKLRGVVESADMEMRFRRQRSTQALTGQGRTAPGTKPSPGSSRRRIKLGYLTFADGVGAALERDED
jgi:hypothetical protein